MAISRMQVLKCICMARLTGPMGNCCSDSVTSEDMKRMVRDFWLYLQNTSFDYQNLSFRVS